MVPKDIKKAKKKNCIFKNFNFDLSSSLQLACEETDNALKKLQARISAEISLENKEKKKQESHGKRRRSDQLLARVCSSEHPHLDASEISNQNRRSLQEMAKSMEILSLRSQRAGIWRGIGEQSLGKRVCGICQQISIAE